MGVVGNFWHYFRYNLDERIVKMTTKSCKSKRAHTPITTKKQAKFMGSEYARAKEGKSRETDMSRDELKRHLREWGAKRNKISRRTK